MKLRLFILFTCSLLPCFLKAQCTADFSFQQDVCSPKTITFSAVVPGVLSYTWDFGNSTTNNSSLTPTVTYNGYNSYTVSLTVSFPDGCSYTRTKIVPVTVVQDNSLISTPDAVICPGENLLLHADGNASNFCWHDASGMLSTSSHDITVSPSAPTVYYYSQQVPGGETVTNGDFSDGNTAFTTNYSYCNSFECIGEGNYAIGPDAQFFHFDFRGYDHTTGTGNFLMANGMLTANSNVWCQTVTVTPNTNYDFSMWICTVAGEYAPAQMQLRINGIPVGPVATAPDAIYTWEQHTTTWNSGASATADLCIVTVSDWFGGNDFGIDDISFGSLTTTLSTDSVFIDVNSTATASISYASPFCASTATAQPVVLSGTGTFTGGTYNAGAGLTIDATTGEIIPSTSTAGSYTVTYSIPAGPGCSVVTATASVTIVAEALPDFAPVNAICSGDVLTALPTTSNDGITGSWSPALNNTATTTYTFTPDAGQCATTATLTIAVNNSTMPTFNPVAAICSGDVLTALPTISTDGITGSWSPALNNTATTTYTFTPDAGQCATTATLTIAVNNSTMPAFNPVAAICSGDVLTALPTTSTDGITGSWSPALNNTATTTYTFTPDAGQCATTASLTIMVNPVLAPTINCGVSTLSTVTFDWTAVPGATGYTVIYQVGTAPVVNVGPVGNVLTYTVTGLNAGDNATITVLPTGPAGTCFGSSAISCTAINCTPPTASISYASPFCSSLTTAQSVALSGTGTFTGGTYGSGAGLTLNSATGDILPSTSVPGIYTVTYTLPASTGCSVVTATTVVNILAVVQPLFGTAQPACAGSILAPLPLTSLNGITGTWSPALNNSQTTLYTFTPNLGQCATTAGQAIVIYPATTSTTTITICGNQLPFSWNGNTYQAQGSYSVTLNSSSGCDSIASLTLIVSNVSVSTTAETVCSDQLPYLWNGQSYPAAGSYSVILTGSSGCDSTANLNLTVTASPGLPNVISPVSYCQFNPTSALSAGITSPGNQLLWYTSLVGGAASFVPPVPSSSVAGTVIYYVSQAGGSCEGPRAAITVTVNSTPMFEDQSVRICRGQSVDMAALYNTAGLGSSWTLNQQPIADASAATVAGTYQLIATTPAGCSDTAAVDLIVNPAVVANAGVDGNAEAGEPYQLSGSGGLTYQWSPAGNLDNPHISNPTAILTHDETFILMAMDAFGCFDLDTVKIRLSKESTFHIPSAFTPNGDGLNDIFKPIVKGIATIEYFRVFNRWGELVFETHEIGQGWNGIYRGVKQPVGDYVWDLKGMDRNAVIKVMHGNVVLIR